MYDKKNLKETFTNLFSRKFAANDFNVLKTYTRNMQDKSMRKPCWHLSCPWSIYLQLSVERITHCKYTKQLATAITVNRRERFAKRHFFTFLAKKKKGNQQALQEKANLVR